MEEKKEEKKLRYNKYNSFVTFKGLAGKKTDNPKEKINLLYKNKTGINNLKNDYISVLEKVIFDLNNDSKKETSFSLTENVIDEIKVRLEINLDKKNKLKEAINRLNFQKSHIIGVWSLGRSFPLGSLSISQFLIMSAAKLLIKK